MSASGGGGGGGGEEEEEEEDGNSGDHLNNMKTHKYQSIIGCDNTHTMTLGMEGGQSRKFYRTTKSRRPTTQD